MSKVSNTPCLIITLCKSLNYGAYLQAFALKKVLEGYGYKVSLLDIYDRENNNKRYKHLFGGMRRNPVSIFFNFRKLFSFICVEKKLNIVFRGDLSGFKVAFIGSDEVWSVTNGSFNSVPEFFGLELPKLLKFSYAPSVGSSELKDIAQYPKYIEGLKKLDFLSARDNESLEVAKATTLRDDISLVLDPTFLYDFSSQEKDFSVDKPYILVYTYGFSNEIVKEVKDYASRNNIALVSAGFHHAWVDMNLPCTPFEFLTLVRNAEYVITDTFHGSIFAIKYRKDFISYGHNKQKVKYLLESLGLSDCLVGAGYLSEGNMIKTDYCNIDLSLDPLLYESRKYLERCNSLVKNKFNY